MQLEIGKIYEGKVKNITQYGAFVDINEGGSGMVHISEISNSFVNEIRDHLTENQEVKVKVIGINEAGKASLSIKKALPPEQQQQSNRNNYNNNRNNNRNNNNSNNSNVPRPQRRNDRPKPNVWEPKKQTPVTELSFEDMLSRFKQNSEDKMCDIKRGTDRKNGSRRK